jgi:hypothetical protein
LPNEPPLGLRERSRDKLDRGGRGADRRDAHDDRAAGRTQRVQHPGCVQHLERDDRRHPQQVDDENRYHQRNGHKRHDGVRVHATN